MSVARELKQLQKKWKKSKAKARREPVPDGDYNARIVDSRLEKSKSSNRLQLAQIFQIVDGDQKDRMIYRYPGLETENNIAYLKGDFKKMNIKVPKNIMNIGKASDACVDLLVSLTIKTNGQFTNVYINDLIEDEQDDEDDDDEEDDE